MSRRGAAAVAFALAWAVAGCVGPGPRTDRSPTLHLSEVVDQGDAARRASLRLVIDGLAADERSQVDRARGLYARALQIDSGNPYAYLALARHYAEQGDPGLALENLARSEDLFAAESLDSPRVEVHLIGLRGVALGLEGQRAESERLLARAASDAPTVWGDGRLDPQELR